MTQPARDSPREDSLTPLETVVEDVPDLGESDHTCPLLEEQIPNKIKKAKSPRKIRQEGNNERGETEEQHPPEPQERKDIRSEKHSNLNVGTPNKKSYQVLQETTERLVTKPKQGPEVTQGPINKTPTFLTQEQKEMFGDDERRSSQ
jgi:hypothetical protein